PRERRILFTGEPPSVKEYNPRFLQQFGTIVGVDSRIDHPGFIRSAQSLPWMVGWPFFTDERPITRGYDDFRNRSYPEKDDRLVIVTSSKIHTAGHRKRYEFALALKKEFKDRALLLGVGIDRISDKWDVLAPHKYALAMENSSYPDYWTEKLSDAFLAGCYPFYHGCSNIGDYFPANSFGLIDPDNLSASIQTIEESIEGDAYSRSASERNSAIDLILDRYNLFARLAEIASRLPAPKREGSSTYTIYPESRFQRRGVRGFLRGLIRR
ncbi:MAG: hypothetical protein KDK33_15080, partial [Leptospiraceae bacterium]|nr:hypothetical protein [Leptospiraceae bacterium]